jgi:hypothetical protein
MAFQYGATLRNNQVSQIQTTVGSTSTLVFYTGAQPANCAASPTGSVLATITLPSTFLTSSGGVATLFGSWATTGSGSGNAGYFRILDGSSVCHVQGSVTATGLGGDMTLNSVVIGITQPVSVTTFSVTAGNS